MSSELGSDQRERRQPRRGQHRIPVRSGAEQGTGDPGLGAIVVLRDAANAIEEKRRRVER
jgi:hypothetical protein